MRLFRRRPCAATPGQRGPCVHELPPLAEIRRDEALAWSRLDPSLRERAVKHLRRVLPPAWADAIRAAIEEHGAEWTSKIGDDPLYVFHFSHGMAIRNMLREAVGDADLPSGNWDDYYVPALEEALC